MKIALFASFIVFSLWVLYEATKRKRLHEKALQKYLDIEAQANSVRKKDLGNLTYITIPEDILSFHLMTDNPTVIECLQQLNSLKDKKIVNLTGITNTELKFTYGTSNITILTEYDQNYTLFARNIYRLGEAVYKEGYIKEAKDILELGVQTKTDISGNYTILAKIFRSLGEIERIKTLKDTASSLNSMIKITILQSLDEIARI